MSVVHEAQFIWTGDFDFLCVITFMYQSIEINNKHVYRQSQVRKPTGSGVEWAECSLIKGTGN